MIYSTASAALPRLSRKRADWSAPRTGGDGARSTVWSCLRSGATFVFANRAFGSGIAIQSTVFCRSGRKTRRAPCARKNPVLKGSIWNVATVATVATHVRVALFLKQRLVESTLGVESRATATKPENKQEVLEPAAPRPLCELDNLLPLHRISAAPAAESWLTGTMARLKFLQIGNLSERIP